MNNPPNKPDPEQFSRSVLWHLCSLQASIAELAANEINRQGRAAGATNEEIALEIATYGQRIRATAEVMYRDALALANIKPSPSYPNPPEE